MCDGGGDSVALFAVGFYCVIICYGFLLCGGAVWCVVRWCNVQCGVVPWGVVMAIVLCGVVQSCVPVVQQGGMPLCGVIVVVLIVVMV